MSEFAEIKNLIENLGYTIVNLNQNSYGLTIKLLRKKPVDKKTFDIAPSNPKYHEIVAYTKEKFVTAK